MRKFKIKILVRQQIEPFLLLNGFVETEEYCYANDFCSVGIEDNGYSVCNNNGDAMYCVGYNIYWLIGVLTYYEFIPMHYKKLSEYKHFK